MARNPFKQDPTRTGMIRRAFVADIRRRFEKIRADAYAYALEMEDTPLTVNASRRYKFNTDPERLTAFRKWLTRQVNTGILEADPATGEPAGDKPWTYKYIDSAYRKGVLRSFAEVQPAPGANAPAGFTEGQRKQFLSSAFGAGERVDKIKLMYTRSFHDLQGVSAAMSAKLNRIMADGIANGYHPLVTARAISREVRKISRTRATAIALTETIHAHSEGQLDGLKDLGIQQVKPDVEFSTAGDDIVCPKCKKLEGKVFTIQQARGKIPIHPRCRCSWLPHVKVPKRKPRPIPAVAI